MTKGWVDQRPKYHNQETQKTTIEKTYVVTSFSTLWLNHDNQLMVERKTNYPLKTQKITIEKTYVVTSFSTLSEAHYKTITNKQLMESKTDYP